MKLFLHIGFPKTGTSAIQNFLQKNKQELLNIDILYPETGWTIYAGQSGLAFAASKKDDKLFNEFIAEVERSGCKSVILSSEYFFMLEEDGISFLASKLKDFDTKILVFFRRQDARIESGYLQVLRDVEFRFSGDIDDYIKYLEKYPRRTDYYKFLQPWSKVFGKNTIHISVYEKAQKGGRLVENFLRMADIINHSANFFFDDRKVNVAYRPYLNRVLMLLNKVPLPRYIYIKILSILNWFVSSLNLEGSVSMHSLLTDEKRAMIIEQYRDSNRKIAKEYLRIDSDLFE